jgi:hypothetical protein
VREPNLPESFFVDDADLTREPGKEELLPPETEAWLQEVVRNWAGGPGDDINKLVGIIRTMQWNRRAPVTATAMPPEMEERLKLITKRNRAHVVTTEEIDWLLSTIRTLQGQLAEKVKS